MGLWPQHPPSWPWGRHAAYHHKPCPFLLQNPPHTSLSSPYHPQRPCSLECRTLYPQKPRSLECRTNPEVRFQQLGLVPFTQKAGHTPWPLCPQQLRARTVVPLTISLPCPALGEDKYHLGVKLSTVVTGMLGMCGGGVLQRKKTEDWPRVARWDRNTVPQRLSGLSGRRSSTGGGCWGLVTERNVFRRCSQHREGLIPTTAAKLFKPQPKRNTPRREEASWEEGA